MCISYHLLPFVVVVVVPKVTNLFFTDSILLSFDFIITVTRADISF